MIAINAVITAVATIIPASILVSSPFPVFPSPGGVEVGVGVVDSAVEDELGGNVEEL